MLVVQEKPVEADPLFALATEYAKDTRENKIDLIVGVYKDPTNTTPVMRAVQDAELRLAVEAPSKAYLTLSGNLKFNEVLTHFFLAGASAPEHTTTVQTVAGSGALRVLSDFLAQTGPDRKVLLGSPSYVNHYPLVQTAGLQVVDYPLLTSEGVLDIAAMLDAVRQANPGDVLLIQGCCHNPTGQSLTLEDWQQLRDALLQAQVVPFIDQAYYGLGDGLEEDLAGTRLLAQSLPEVVISVSGSKAFSLYNERVGAAIVVSKTTDPDYVRTSLETIARASYSQPPNHGAQLVIEVLTDPELKAVWNEELVSMQQRLTALRKTLVQELLQYTDREDIRNLISQRGMFLFLPLNSEQMAQLRHDDAIYGASSGRINLAAVQEDDIPRIAKAIAKLL